MILFFFYLQIIVLAFTSNLYGGLGSDVQATCAVSLEGLGWIMSISQVGLLVAFACYPAMVRKFGPYRTMVIGVFGTGIGLLLQGFSRTAFTFGASFFLWSILDYPWASAKFSVVTFSQKDHKERNISAMHLIYAIGSIFAGMYVTKMKGPGWYHAYLQNGVAWLVLGCVFALLTPLARRNPDLMVHHANGTSKMKDGFSLLGEKRFVLFYLFLILSSAGESLAMIYPLLFLQQGLGSSASAVGLAVTLFSAGMTGSRLLLIPCFTKSKHTFAIISVLTTIVAVGLLGMGLAKSVPLALAFLTISGFGFGALNPMAQMLEIHIWPDKIDQVMNMHSISGTVGKLFLPVVIGAISSKISLAGGVISIGIMMALSLFLLNLCRKACS